ncbi:putative protein phosphatase 2C 33 isoform X3 [Apium graveolens]|uniref:putative protein phosphatase 2C 33 isoform X3 n=1 Tax=Apium graveolens TaxID=4045 RepID=UPI003D7AE1ED
MVAKRVRDSLLLKLSTHWEVHAKTDDVLREISLNGTGSLNSENTSFLNDDEEPRASVVVEKTEKHTNMFQTLKESFFEAYKVMDRELKMYTNIDCLCSGITAVTLIKQGQDLVNSNVGDSRAVMGTRDKDDYLTAIRTGATVFRSIVGGSSIEERERCTQEIARRNISEANMLYLESPAGVGFSFFFK